MHTYDLELVRSDTGDGGWSLHAPELDDEDGQSPVLVSGEAEWDETANHGYGDWNRPNQGDYDEAQKAREAARRLKCFWITYYNDRGERWDEGTPYAATDADDAERQMIVNGCGGDANASMDDLRALYRDYFSGDEREVNNYRIAEAEGWSVNANGFPERA